MSKKLAISIAAIIVLCLATNLGIRFFTYSDAKDIAPKLCDWIFERKQSSRLILPNITTQMYAKISNIQAKERSDLKCEVERSSFNESIMETSILIYVNEFAVLGLIPKRLQDA